MMSWVVALTNSFCFFLVWPCDTSNSYGFRMVVLLIDGTYNIKEGCHLYQVGYLGENVFA